MPSKISLECALDLVLPLALAEVNRYACLDAAQLPALFSRSRMKAEERYYGVLVACEHDWELYRRSAIKDYVIPPGAQLTSLWVVDRIDGKPHALPNRESREEAAVIFERGWRARNPAAAKGHPEPKTPPRPKSSRMPW